MEEIANLIGNYGAMVIIVVLFLWDWVCNKKDIKNTLEEMKKANTNTSKTLELLQKSMDNQYEFLQVHDRRCENIEKSIEKIEIRMEGK